MAYRVFLSSTAADLDPWRTAVHREVSRVDKVRRVVWMKDWMANPATSMQVCEEKVRTSQIFVALVGHCFGSAPKDRPERSYTMLEFDWAQDAGLPCLMHRAPEKGFNVDIGLINRDGPENQARQRAFREETAGWHSGQSTSWNTEDRLAADVAEAVRQQIVRMEAARQEGFTREKHEVSLLDRLNDLAIAIAKAPEAERATLRAEHDAVEAKLRDLESSFASAQTRIEELEALLERAGNEIGAERLERAEAALANGDFDEADALLAEIEADADLAIQRAARAAFGRGQIAEEQVRWHDAAAHYTRAAELDPSFDHLCAAREFCWRAGNYVRALELGEALIYTARAEFGEEAAEFAVALNEHGLTLWNAGRYEQAEPLFRQAIEIGKATTGEAHPAYATRLNNLANLLRDMGQPQEAEPLYRQAIEIDKAALGEAHPDYAMDLNNLASLLQVTGRQAEAEPLFRHAIEIGKATLGEAHPNYAIRLNNLAGLLQDMGRHDEAEPLFRQAIEITRAALGEAHPTYAIRLGNYAGLLIAMGRPDEAEPLRRKEYEIMTTVHGKEHPHVAIASRNLASFLRAHFPDDPALKELEDTFGPDIGKDET